MFSLSKSESHAQIEDEQWQSANPKMSTIERGPIIEEKGSVDNGLF
jgi:hypothetical protein